LADEIRDRGYIFNLSPQKLNDHLHKVTDELGIPRFRFHDLRSYFASYASTLNIPEADIMKMGGWKSDFVFKRIYRESLDESYKESAKRISDSILG
jgi:integrase